ncbi:MAG: class I SAM-dependent methyltransferase [bacterium]|nr:class I SAM-dependent methyltransferase [bacterium]
MKLDRFDTPRHVVDDLFSIVKDHLGAHSGAVLDPAVGSGALLEPFLDGRLGWTATAVDIDPSAIAALSARWSDCSAICADFLQLDRSMVGMEERRTYEAVVLNPPFSERGAQKSEATVAAGKLRSSRSLSFVLAASGFVAAGGVLAAILPLSALRAEKNTAALRYLQSKGRLTARHQYPRRAFPNVVASTCLVTWMPTTPALSTDLLDVDAEVCASSAAKIIRGWIPMHSRRLRHGPWRPLVHTSDLRMLDGSGDPTRRCRSERHLLGPAVLLPRVGRLAEEQIVVLADGGPVCLSDCVLAVQANSDVAAAALAALLRAEIHSLQSEYQATGAPYITIDRLSAWLVRSGVLQRADQRNARQVPPAVTITSAPSLSAAPGAPLEHRELTLIRA